MTTLHVRWNRFDLTPSSIFQSRDFRSQFPFLLEVWKLGLFLAILKTKCFMNLKCFQIILQSTEKAIEDVKKCLTVLNNVLLTKTFLVGERVSLADISVGCNLLMLYKQVCNNSNICFNPLSPNNHTQILQSDLHTFPLRISWENLTKDQGIVSLVIILLISHNHFSWQSMDILRRKLILITIGI